ncbi:unnamed protein product, partial [marine sediment metagenome]
KKGKMLNIAVHSDDNEIRGNFKLDPKGVTVGKGGYIADTDEAYSLTSDGVVKKGVHNYSENIDEPYTLYANQDLVGRVGKKVNLKKKYGASKVIDKKKTKKREEITNEIGGKATNVSKTKEVTRSRRGGKVIVTKKKSKNSLDTGGFQITTAQQKGRKTKSKTKEVKGKSLTRSGNTKDAGQRKQTYKSQYTTKGQKSKFGGDIGYEGKSKYKSKNYGEYGIYKKGAKTKEVKPATN